MKIGRYEGLGITFYGELDGETVYPLEGELHQLRRQQNASPMSVNELRVLAPVLPGKMIAIGPGHNDVVPEGVEPPEYPYLFSKPTSCVANPGDPIIYPKVVSNILYEIEIAVVIGKTTKNVSEIDALDYVLGYTCCNDVTAGSLKKDWGTPASYYWKAYDTFGPLGPVITTNLEIEGLAMVSRINGEVHADTTVSLIYTPQKLISWISHIMTLNPGDVISLGAAAQADLKPGDICEIEIEGIGILSNPVVAER